MLKTETPLWIFDIDGTVADIEHRVHLVNGARNTQDWERFYKECAWDAPNTPVIRVLNALLGQNHDVIFFSGRSDEVRSETALWLEEHTDITRYSLEQPGTLMMRPAGDYTKDELLKKKWLDEMLDVDRKRLADVFEDRARMAKMWRENNIPCFQVKTEITDDR